MFRITLLCGIAGLYLLIGALITAFFAAMKKAKGELASVKDIVFDIIGWPYFIYDMVFH